MAKKVVEEAVDKGIMRQTIPSTEPTDGTLEIIEAKEKLEPTEMAVNDTSSKQVVNDDDYVDEKVLSFQRSELVSGNKKESDVFQLKNKHVMVLVSVILVTLVTSALGLILLKFKFWKIQP